MRARLSLVVLCAFAAACGGGGSTTAPTGGTSNTPTTPTTPSSPSSPVLTNQVTIGNDFFNPTDIQVTPGTTVTWTWGQGAITHNVTFTDGGSSSGDRSSGSFSRTFNTAGTFNYSCTLHGGMNGSVTVK